MGYKGMARIARSSSSIQPTVMKNPFIGDAYFLDNPTKVLGEQTIRKGRFGDDIIVVKGTPESIAGIDAYPLEIPDILTPAAQYTTKPKNEIIAEVFQHEVQHISEKHVKRLRAKKDTPVLSSEAQDVFSFREISNMYNKAISRDEMEAYYFTHPELNYKLLIDEFVNTRQQLIEKDLICWYEGAWHYVYTFLSGNISKKISHLKRDMEKAIEVLGEARYEKQLQMLESVRPKQKSLVGEDSLTLLPHSAFAKEMMITGFRYGKPELHRETSLKDAFKSWLRELPPDQFNKANYREIIKYYLDNEAIPISDGPNKERDEKLAINTRQTTKEEGDRLFAKMLAEDLAPEDQSRIIYLWNEKFNSYVEPNLSKTPVCFQISKTFKANAPFIANPTQIRAASFQMEKQSGLLAYGVGVGKTGAAIICGAQAYYNNLAKKLLYVVPTNTYDKWIGEIQGYTDKRTGQFMHGLLPQMPKVVGLFNLNPVIVREQVKIYSPQEEKQFEALEELIAIVKKMASKPDFTDVQKKEIAKFYTVPWGGIEAEYKAYTKNSKSANPKSFVQFTADFLKDEYNSMIYKLGRVRSYEDGTIFVITEVGLQRLGISDANKEWMNAVLYEILSQGEKAASMSDKRAEKAAAALEVRIESMISVSQKKAALSIEDFGIDWACFDEAHMYKKLFTMVKGEITGEKQYGPNAGKMEREKSKYELKSGAYPSARALSAFALSYYIQKKNQNRNVLLLTATPFTNSPLEVYSMLVFANFAALQEMGLGNMVDFFDTFMRINYDIKYTPQKTVVKDVVLTGYNNLSQLRQVVYSLMDKKDEGANLKRPTKHIWPSLQNGIETTIPMTAEQEYLMNEVKQYINGKLDYDIICQQALEDEVEAMDFDGLDDETLIAEWERVTEREFEGERENLPESRRDAMIKQIKNVKVGGKEMSVDDLEEDEKAGVRVLRGLSMMRQITLSPYLYHKACKKAKGETLEMPDFRDYVESSPKLRYVMGCIKSIIDFHRERDEKISGQVVYMNTGTEYFPLIKEYAVKTMGLHDHQVGLVTGSMTKAAKEKVKNGFLSGDILILIGSSSISVGVDLQNNATSLYNCYYDWNPTDAQQIEGRIWRQGNRFANVRIVYPQCYNSSDPIIFEYLNSKTLRINEIWNRSSELQELDLRDFNPKELQKKLITDPEEKADWEILEETDSLRTSLLFYRNRLESIEGALRSFKKIQNNREEVRSILQQVGVKALEAKRQKAIAKQEKAVEDIRFSMRFEEPEKRDKAVEKYLKGAYPHNEDPDGRYIAGDYSVMDDAQLAKQASKIAAFLTYDMTYSDASTWGDIYYGRNGLADTLDEFYNAFNDISRASERILKPLGINLEDGTDPLIEFNRKITEFEQQLADIENSRPERILRIKAELAATIGIKKTVEDRIAEFAAPNARLIPPQLSTEAPPPELLVPEAPEAIELQQDIEPPVMPEAPEVVVAPAKKRKKVAEARIEQSAAAPLVITRDIIETQINALNLALKYASGDLQTAINDQINSLTISLKYI